MANRGNCFQDWAAILPLLVSELQMGKIKRSPDLNTACRSMHQYISGRRESGWVTLEILIVQIILIKTAF